VYKITMRRRNGWKIEIKKIPDKNSITYSFLLEDNAELSPHDLIMAMWYRYKWITGMHDDEEHVYVVENVERVTNLLSRMRDYFKRKNIKYSETREKHEQGNYI